MIVLGIDPGMHTGYAHWHVPGQRLVQVCSMAIHEALDTVRKHAKAASNAGCPNSVLVIFEDARLRTWFGKAGREVLQGVGSVKRDCSIWEDFLLDHGIPFMPRKPMAHGTKWPSVQFQRMTGWQGKTNEHGRDAAMLVHGLTSAMVANMMSEVSRRAQKATGT